MPAALPGMNFTIITVGTVAALTFWHEILSWAENSLFPWIQKWIPSILQFVKKAFVKLDNLATTARNLIKQAWTALRQYLLKQSMKLLKKLKVF